MFKRIQQVTESNRIGACMAARSGGVRRKAPWQGATEFMKFQKIRLVINFQMHLISKFMNEFFN